MSALLVKKTIFPYKDINDRDLNREYETCPPIKQFADNVSKKSKTEEEEVLKLTPVYESVKKMWELLNLKTLRPLLKLYWVMDTVSLGAALMDFDGKMFESIGYHMLNVASIFKFTSKYNIIRSGISICQPQSLEHYHLIEKMLTDGMATNEIVLYGSDSSDFSIPIPHYQQCIKMYDENGQYSCAQLTALPMQMEQVDYLCKLMEEVVAKYHQPFINGFGRTALVYMNIEISKEFQDKMSGYSPIIERCESQMEELGPFETEHIKKRLKNGQFSLALSSTPKLVFKLLDMIRLWGCKVKSMWWFLVGHFRWHVK